MLTDESRLPKSVTGMFGVAGSLYVRRAALYLTLAAIVLAVQYVVGVVLPHSDGLVVGLSIVVDAFYFAAVSIGVAFDLAEKEVDWSTILLAANERWGVVSIVCLAYWLVFILLAPNVFLQPDDVASGFLIVPIVVFWGAIQVGQVVASIEPVKTQLSLPVLAIGKGLAVSLRWVNVGRLVLLSLIVVLPTFATLLLGSLLTAHHVHDAAFWGNVPLDALTVGPIAALTTVFYIDFLRRARG